MKPKHEDTYEPLEYSRDDPYINTSKLFEHLYNNNSNTTLTQEAQNKLDKWISNPFFYDVLFNLHIDELLTSIEDVPNVHLLQEFFVEREVPLEKQDSEEEQCYVRASKRQKTTLTSVKYGHIRLRNFTALAVQAAFKEIDSTFYQSLYAYLEHVVEENPRMILIDYRYLFLRFRSVLLKQVHDRKHYVLQQLALYIAGVCQFMCEQVIQLCQKDIQNSVIGTTVSMEEMISKIKSDKGLYSILERYISRENVSKETTPRSSETMAMKQVIVDSETSGYCHAMYLNEFYPEFAFKVWFNSSLSSIETIARKVYEKSPDFLVFKDGKMPAFYLYLSKVQLNHPDLFQEVVQILQNRKTPAPEGPSVFLQVKQKYAERTAQFHANYLKANNELFQVCQKPNNYWKNLSDRNYLSNEQLLLDVLKYLDISTLFAIKGVCREWFRLIVCPTGSTHKPLITSFDISQVDLNYRTQHTTVAFRYLILSFGHNLTSLSCTSYQVNPRDLDFIGNCCQKLQYLNLEGATLTTEILTCIGKTNPDIQYLYMMTPFSASPAAIFKNCKNLREVQVTSDESDISTQGVTDRELELLANNANGEIVKLNFGRCCSEVSDSTMANLVRHCPKLRYFEYSYACNEDVEDVEGSETVEALSELKQLEQIKIGYLSEEDQIKLKKFYPNTIFN